MIDNIRKRVKEIKKNMTLSKVYLITFSSFIIAFLFVFISPSLTGGTYQYKETKINEFELLSNNLEIGLVKKQYNPKKEIMRLDFYIKETTTNSSLSNIKYEINSRYIKAQNELLKTEITKVDDHYFVVMIEGLPEDFSVLSTSIIPKYIHPEIEKVDNLKEREVKIYINESSKLVNNKLKVGSEKEYKKEYINFQQDELLADIEENKKQIKTNELAIAEINKTIEDLELEKSYQTEEEKLETENEINGYKTTIEQHESEIETLNKTIEDMYEKISLLEEKRTSI